MKWMTLVLAAALAFGAAGLGTAADDKLTIKAPGNVTLKPGESHEISVGVTRPDDDGDVTVKVQDLPKGVSVDRSVTLKKGDKTAKFVLKIDGTDKDVTEVANHKATVVATHKGKSVKETFNVTVKKK